MSNEGENVGYTQDGKKFTCNYCQKELKSEKGIKKHLEKCDKKPETVPETKVEENIAAEPKVEKEKKPKKSKKATEPSSGGGQSGTVKWFNNKKGYGFITPEGAGSDTKDVFVHYSNIVAVEGEFRKLKEGETVQYEVKQGEKGPEAINVVKKSSKTA